MKQFCVTLLNCAPASCRSAEVGIHIPKARQRQAGAAVVVESVRADQRVPGTALQAVKRLSLKVLPLIGPSPQAPRPRFAPVSLLSMKFPVNCGSRAPAVLWSTLRTPSTKNPVAGDPVYDTVVREPEPVEVVLVQVKEVATADFGGPVDLILIDGDVHPVVVKKHPVTGELADAVVEQLEPIDRAGVETQSPAFRQRS